MTGPNAPAKQRLETALVGESGRDDRNCVEQGEAVEDVQHVWERRVRLRLHKGKVFEERQFRCVVWRCHNAGVWVCVLGGGGVGER